MCSNSVAWLQLLEVSDSIIVCWGMEMCSSLAASAAKERYFAGNCRWIRSRDTQHAVSIVESRVATFRPPGNT